MPFLDGGDLDAAARQIARQRRGVHAVGRARLRDRHPVAELQPHDPRGVSAARRRAGARATVAGATHDLGDYLYRIAREGRLKRDFTRRFGRVRTTSRATSGCRTSASAAATCSSSSPTTSTWCRSAPATTAPGACRRRTSRTRCAGAGRRFDGHASRRPARPARSPAPTARWRRCRSIRAPGARPSIRSSRSPGVWVRRRAWSWRASRWSEQSVRGSKGVTSKRPEQRESS